MSPTLDKNYLARPLHAVKKVVRTLDRVWQLQGPRDPKPTDLAEKFNLDKGIGNQAHVEDLTQFIDFGGFICPKLRLVETCQRLKIATPWVTHLTNTL